ncbi:MAG: transposase, partial [Halobacteriovoraceae bacterium]|nr:transposase [Halobacteriovoraceae bacterium]
RVIQWLSDRGSIYRSHNVIEFARTLGLKSCFTAAYSPQSNGMSEAFVGTLKRDYVYTSDCYDAKSVLEMLPEWIKDYNENAPHSGLKMMSPLEYRRSIN